MIVCQKHCARQNITATAISESFLSALVVALAILLIAPPATAASIFEYAFSIEPRKTPNGYRLYALNKGPATISLHASITGQNYDSDVQWPISVAVRPHSSIELANLFQRDKSQPIDFKIKTSRAYGDITAQPNPQSVYRLPFPNGHGYVVGQAHGGTVTTHTEIYNKYAVDFVMPEGTPIVAARGGTVIEVEIGHSEGGTREDLLAKANRIVIMHADGTMATYAHLAQRPPIVFPGRRVNEGELIGWSGNTGFSSGPHTHFAITRATLSPEGSVVEESIPIAFYAYSPAQVFSAAEGMVASANYFSPPLHNDGVQHRSIELAAGDTGVQAVVERIRATAETTEVLVFHTDQPWWIWAISIAIGLGTTIGLSRFLGRTDR